MKHQQLCRCCALALTPHAPGVTVLVCGQATAQLPNREFIGSSERRVNPPWSIPSQRNRSTTQFSNHYLRIKQAGLIAAGLAGVAAKADPGPRFDTNFYEERPPPGVRFLPGNLLDALRCLQARERTRESTRESVPSVLP